MPAARGHRRAALVGRARHVGLERTTRIRKLFFGRSLAGNTGYRLQALGT